MAPLRTAHPKVAPDQFRGALSRFATGVTVVTTLSPDGDPVGTTVSAFSSLSLDPPLILVSLARTSRTLAALRDHGELAVNVLAEGSEAVSNAFARSANDAAWDVVRHHPGDNGAPVLEGAHVTLECSVEQLLPGGDHDIVIGRVTAVREGESTGAPLLHYAGRYGALANSDAAPSDDATRLAEAELRIAEQVRRQAEDDTRLRAELEAVECALPTRDGHFRILAYERDATDVTALLVHGDPQAHPAPVLAAHEACLLGDVLGSLACDCGQRLTLAQQAIARAGAGAILYTKRSGADTFLCAAGVGPDLTVGAGLLRRAGIDPALLHALKRDQNDQETPA